MDVKEPRAIGCPACGESQALWTYHCMHCGAVLPEVPVPAPEPPKAQPVWQFLLLYYSTFGVYQLVWFYRTWGILKREYQMDVWPLVRAFFAVLWFHDYFRRVFQLGEKHGFQSRITMEWVAVSWLALTLTGRVCFQLGVHWPSIVTGMLVGVFLVPAVEALAAFWQGEQGTRLYKKLSPWEIAAVAVGFALWGLALLGQALPAPVPAPVPESATFLGGFLLHTR